MDAAWIPVRAANIIVRPPTDEIKRERQFRAQPQGVVCRGGNHPLAELARAESFPSVESVRLHFLSIYTAVYDNDGIGSHVGWRKIDIRSDSLYTRVWYWY